MAMGALLMAATLAGCGNTMTEDSATAGDMMSYSEYGDEPQEHSENPIVENKQVNSDEPSDASEVEALPYKYMKSMIIEDYYGDMAEYEIYAPKGSSYENGLVYYYEHGLSCSASVIDCGSSAYIQEFVEDSMSYEMDIWREQSSDYTDIEVSDVTKSGDDYYQIASAKRRDVFDIPYTVKQLYYADVMNDGLVVLWMIKLDEQGMDEETDQLLDELSQCYAFNVAEIRPDGEWAAANEARIRAVEAENSLPQTVLWFNATYAPQTQANKSFGTNWKLVGGMKATEYNAEFCQENLVSGWKITDAASALETVESLKENGHREICRQCMEELAQMELLDVDDETFLESLAASQIEDNPYRYVIAYYMHKNGMSADDIAAWDLCRVNQLYAQFYICGYMTYEEAMDASLENSLILQEMYSSWEDMVQSYLLGYQFWTGDLALEEDSPTQQRFQCYLELLAMEDGPYTLDWNLDLSKSW